MGGYMHIIYDYNLASAAFCAAVVIIAYIPIRAVWLKTEQIRRRPLTEEIARALLAGYIAALINIVWIPVPEAVDTLLSDPRSFIDYFRGGYYARNYEVLRCLFVEFRPLMLLHDFEMLANIALFVPLGFLLPTAFGRLKWWQVDLICLSTTCIVEFVQPFFGRACDLDDIIMNALGGIIGCALVKLTFAIFVRKRRVAYEKQGE